MQRILHLTNPHMKGSDVGDAQYLLNRAGFSGHLNIDDDFGIATATACKETKWGVGYPGDKIEPSFGQTLYDFLTERTSYPADYIKRAKNRAAYSNTDLAKRKKAVEYGLWGIAHESSIHYSQVRPNDRMDDLLHLPIWDDCSEFCAKAYKYGGLPNPSGGSWLYGNTDTMLQHMKQISRESIKLADLVVWGSLPNSHHVAMVIELGLDPVLVSHGQEAGPRRIRFSVENEWQNYRTAHWLTLP